MSFSYFLYRRLARWITCTIRVGEGRLRLRSKYDVASFQDVFCGPYYWQLYPFLPNRPPAVVVDAGANVGHFTVLANCCIKTKFGTEEKTHFYLVEPNPFVQRLLDHNLQDSGIRSRCTVIKGLLGKPGGTGALHIDSRNFLTSTVADQSAAGRVQVTVPFVNLAQIVPGDIDILKVDIEGSEFAFISSSADVLRRTKLLLLELHQTEPAKRQEMLKRIGDAGLQTVFGPLALNGQELFIFRQGTA